MAQAWNDRVIALLEQIVRNYGLVPVGGGGVIIHWNDRVIRLLQQIVAGSTGATTDTRVQEFVFGLRHRVPPGGAWLEVAGVASSVAPLVIGTACHTRRATLSVDRADLYAWRAALMRGGPAGTTLESIVLAAGQTQAVVTLAATALASGDRLAVELAGMTQANVSAFQNVVLNLELLES